MVDTTAADFFPIRFILRHVVDPPRVVRSDGGVVCSISQVSRKFFAEMRYVEERDTLTVYPQKEHVIQEFLALSREPLPVCPCACDALYVTNVLLAALCGVEDKPLSANSACDWCVLEVVLRVYSANVSPEALVDIPRISLTWWLLHHKRMSQVHALVAAFAAVNAQLAGYTCYNENVGWGPCRERLAIRRR